MIFYFICFLINNLLTTLKLGKQFKIALFYLIFSVSVCPIEKPKIIKHKYTCVLKKYSIIIVGQPKKITSELNSQLYIVQKMLARNKKEFILNK